jgi:hypothetical protein
VEAPPSMTGGPGSTAKPPMPGQGGDAGGAAGVGGANVPQTTPPATTPGGGAAAGAGAPPGATPPVTGSFARLAAELTRGVENPDDPTGLGDEFLNKALPKQLEQRPRQSAEHRDVNTPQNVSKTPGIPQLSSPGPGDRPEDDDEGDED